MPFKGSKNKKKKRGKKIKKEEDFSVNNILDVSCAVLTVV